MQEHTADLKYWVAFNRIASLGRARYALLEGRFNLLEDAWHAGAAELREAGLEDRIAHEIVQQRERIDPDMEMAKLAEHGVTAVTINDAAYPHRLKEVYDAPPVLYIRGDLTPDDEWGLTVVGTRSATDYGLDITAEMSGGLARDGITVISGLALGIDGAAHRAALSAGGRTIAVLACGPDLVYPLSHARLAREIEKHGALVSEYPLGTKPRPQNFPRRNRIMSGMSLGVLVIEGKIDSGSMITAKLALEQNREVFAVPGSIRWSKGRGTNEIIKRGWAKLAQGVDDILEELNLSIVPRQMEMQGIESPLPIDDNERALLAYLSQDPQHIDDVCRQSGLPTPAVIGALAQLELKGIVRNTGSMNYMRIREAESAYQT